MNKYVLVLLLLVGSSPASWALDSDTRGYLNALEDFSDAGYLDAAALERVYAGCQEGVLPLPITEKQASVNPQHRVVYEILLDWHKAPLDFDRVCNWANEKHHKLHTRQEEQKSARSATKYFAPPPPPVALATTFGLSCAIADDDSLQCWGGQRGAMYGLRLAAHVAPAVLLLPSLFFGNFGRVKPILWHGFKKLLTAIAHAVIEGPIPVPPQVSNVQSIALGRNHGCALLHGGRVRCWGSNSWGQSTPPDNLGHATAVVCGEAHTCVLQADHVLRCFGRNRYGESEYANHLQSVLKVFAGPESTCVVFLDGTARCYGGNKVGLFDDLQDVDNFSLSDSTSCVVFQDHVAHCEGIYLPIDLFQINKIDQYGYMGCALFVNQTVSCWNLLSKDYVPTPSPKRAVIDLALAKEHVCLIYDDSTVECFGSNHFGEVSSPPHLRIKAGSTRAPAI